MNRIMIYDKGGDYCLCPEEVICLIGEGRCTKVYTINPKDKQKTIVITSCKNLGQFEQQLKPFNFQRASKNSIVGLHAIFWIGQDGKIEFRHACECSITVSPLYRKQLREKLGFRTAA